MKLTLLLGREIPEIRYLPKGFDVRRFLYINGSGFPTLSEKLRIDKAKEINKDLAIKDIKIRELQINELRKAKLIPPDIDDEIILRNGILPSELHVDHIKPLAKHWVDKGYNCSDEERNYEASKGSNFNVIYKSYNTAKDSEDEWGIRYFYSQKPYVGRNFSSMNSDSPLGAMKIKGMDFILP